MLTQDLQVALKDLLFSFSAQSYILLSQSKLRARDVYQQILLRSHDLIALSKRQSQELFHDVHKYFLSLCEQERMEEYRVQLVEHIREIFGTDSLFLSDFYYGLAEELDRQSFEDDALEYAGRALVIRMKLTGIMSEKTGESHLQLGVLYYKKQYDEEAKRELYAGRIVLSKIHGEESLAIANIDCMIGESEMRSFNYLNAFVAFLRCYRSRYFLLGEPHPSTDLAKSLLNDCRNINGTIYYCGVELKDRIRALGWVEFHQRSQQNIVAIFINRLADDVILTDAQLENLVHASISFHENLINSLIKKDPRYEMEQVDQTMSVYDILRLISMQSPPYRSKSTNPVTTVQVNPPTESKKAPTTPNTISKLLNASRPVERPKQLTPARGTSASLESKNSVDSPPPHPLLTKSSSYSNKSVSSTITPVQSSNSISSSTTNSATQGRPDGIVVETKSVSSTSTEVIAYKIESKSSESAPKISLSLDSASRDQPSSVATTPSTSSSKQKTWRTIPMNSPLRRAANPNLGFTNIDLGDKNYHLARSDASGLLFVRKCSADVLRQAVRTKILAVGLFAWYCSGRTLEDKSAKKSDGASGVGGKGDAHTALNALFGKKDAGASAAAAAPAPPKEEEPTNGPKFAKNPPRPPPVPNCWPPIPYTPDEAKLDKSNTAGGEDKDGDGPVDPSLPPKPKLKQVFLTSLPSIEGTFWAEPQDNFIPVEELFDDLEEEFAIGGTKKKPAMGGGKPAPKPAAAKASKPPAETVLDPQRGQNINIMLAKFGKKSLENIAESVVAMDSQTLGASVINILLQFIPTADELAKVTTFVKKKHLAPPPPPTPSEPTDDAATSPTPPSESKEEKSSEPSTPPPPAIPPPSNKIDQKRLTELKIGKAEQFIFHMSKIKKMDKRLTAMSFLLTAQEVQQQIMNQSELLLNAVAEVRGCSRLKFILKTCLDLNNQLAKYSKSSSTMAGISISSWAKLSQVKLNSGETAQQYIVNKLMAHIPEALELSNDMPSIDEAKSVLMNRLAVDLKKLEETKTLLEEIKEHDKKEKEHPEKCEVDEKVIDLSLKNLDQHLEHITKLHNSAKEKFELAQKDFIQLVTYFGETSPPAEPETFFGELSTICKGLQSATATATTKQRRKAVGK